MILGALAWAAEPADSPPGEAPPADSPPGEAPPAEAPPAEERDEDAIFGGAPASPEADPPEAAAPATPDPASPSPDPGDPLSTGTGPSDAAIFARLAEVDDRLAIGGRVYLRADVGVDEQADASSDTSAEATADASGSPGLSTPALLELYADVRPNDLLRAYGRGRVSHDFAIEPGDTDAFGNERSPTTVVLDQLWFNTSLSNRVYLTLGRQRIKWGAGRFWNPTDFLNQQVLDPLEAFDERTGVALVKAHVPWAAAGLNVYLLANLEGAGRVDEVGGAARVEWVRDATEVTLSAAARKDQPLRFGADLSTALGFLDLRLEGAVQRGLDAPYWEGELDLAGLVFPTEVDRSDEWIPRLVAGVEVPVRYNDEDTVTIGAEGFYNGAGYDDASLYPWLVYAGGFQPFYLGTWYAAAYVYLPAPGRWNDHAFTLSGLTNLSDRTGVARLDWRVTVLTRLSLNAYVASYLGEAGGELRFSIDIPAAPVEGLEDGVYVPPPLLDAGLGLQLVF